jgi:hypothetical protein
MTPSSGGPDASKGEPGELVARNAFRPLPPEPAPPERMRGCKRDVSCRVEEAEPLTLAYPPPFERCVPLPAFSPKETRDARVDDTHACCYVEFTGCRRSAALSELRTPQLRSTP